jgi:hypothetical protein
MLLFIASHPMYEMYKDSHWGQLDTTMALEPFVLWERKEKKYQEKFDEVPGPFSIGQTDYHLAFDLADLRYGLFGVEDIGTNVGKMLGKDKIRAVMLLGATRDADVLRATNCHMKQWLTEEVFNDHVYYLSTLLTPEERVDYEVDGKMPAVRQFLSVVDVVVIQANQVKKLNCKKALTNLFVLGLLN